MNWNDVAGNWAEYSKKAHSNWTLLTQEQLQNSDGSREALSALIQSAYGYNEQEASKQIDDWLSNLLGHSEQPDAKLDEKLLDKKLKDNQDTAETIAERDEVLGSPYHKG